MGTTISGRLARMLAVVAFTSNPCLVAQGKRSLGRRPRTDFSHSPGLLQASDTQDSDASDPALCSIQVRSSLHRFSEYAAQLSAVMKAGIAEFPYPFNLWKWSFGHDQCGNLLRRNRVQAIQKVLANPLK